MGNYLMSYEDCVINACNIKNNADKGHIESQYEMGDLYYYGYYNNKNMVIYANIPNAVRYYKKAAKKGHEQAKEKLKLIEDRKQEEKEKQEQYENEYPVLRARQQKIFDLAGSLNNY